jgi:molecular chaperone HtpG
LYASDQLDQHNYIEAAKAKGYDVLLMDGQLDTHFVNQLEQKFKDSRFVRVDSDIVDKLIEKDEKLESKLTDEQKQDMIPVFASQVPDKAKYQVSFESMSESAQPIVITQSEFMRRMKDMSEMGGGMGFYGDLPETYNLAVNANHPLVVKIAADKESKLGDKVKEVKEKISPLQDELDQLNKELEKKKEEEISQEQKDKKEDLQKKIDGLNAEKREHLEKFGGQNKVVKQLIDLALLANNMLKGEELTKFVKRSVELIK